MTSRKPARLTAVVLLILWLTLTATVALAHPGSGIAVTANGQVFFTDTGRGIWRIANDGALTLISESAMHWMAIDHGGRFSNSPDTFGEWFGRLTPRGEKPTLISCSDFPCVVGQDGNLYYAKKHGLTIIRRTPHGQETTLVSRDDFGIAADLPVGVNGMASGSDGTLYLITLESLNKHVGSGEHVLYAISQNGSIQSIAKLRDLLPPSDQHPEVRPQYCRGMAVDEQGNIFVAVTGNRCVMQFTPQGADSVILRCQKPWSPTGVAVSQGNVYVLEYDDETPTEGRNWPPRVRKLSHDGSVATLATVRGNASAPRRDTPPQLVLQAPPATSTDSVTVSPDGSLVATATGEGGIRLYNAHTGEFLRVLGPGGDRCVVFSPDGKTVTAAGFHMDKLVSLWDVQTGAALKTFAGHTEWEADATAISPDGKLVASTAVDRQLLIWEISTGKLLLQLTDQPSRLPALKFSPDGKTLAVGGSDKLVRLLEIPSGKLLRSFTGHGDTVCTLAFSPDGLTLASGSCDWGFHRGHDWPRGSRGTEQCEWRLWDVATGELRRTAKSTGRLQSLAFVPNGKSLVCGIGKEVRLFDLTATDDGRKLTSHDADVTAIAVTPDSAAVLSGSHDQTVKRTNLATNELQWQAPGYYEQVNSVALSDDGRLLLTGSSDHRFARGRPEAKTVKLGPGSVRLWDLRTGHVLHQVGDASDQIMAVAISRNGQHLAAGGLSASGTGFVRAWNGATNRWTHHDHTQEVLAIAVSPNGQLIASGSADGVMKIRNLDTGETKQTLTGHQGGVTSLIFSPDGKTLYCGEAPGSIRTWAVATGKLLDVYKQGESRATGVVIDRRLTSLGLTHDGKTLLTCGSSVNNEFVDPAKLWNAQTGKLIREFATENIHGRPTAISPDGSIIATGGKSVKLWDAKTGQPLRELNGHLKRTQSIVFSADGRRVIAGGSYGTTNIWDVFTGRHLVTLFAFPSSQNGTSDDWIAHLPAGHYTGSLGSEKYLAWRIGEELQTPTVLGRDLHRPDLVEAALKAD